MRSRLRMLALCASAVFMLALPGTALAHDDDGDRNETRTEERNETRNRERNECEGFITLSCGQPLISISL